MFYDRLVTSFEYPDEQRCTWFKANGQRCKQPRASVVGNEWTSRDPTTDTLCRWHEERLADRVRRFRIAEELPDMTIEHHMGLQLKMAWVMVKELEFQVLDLGLSMDAWRIDTTETETRTGEDAKNEYVSHKTAQLHGAHPVVVQYLRERDHYVSVTKMCVSAGIAAKQIMVVERYAEAQVASLVELAQALGHDPNDSAVRATIMETVRKQLAELKDVVGEPPAELTA
jgi:hypothetical protein